MSILSNRLRQSHLKSLRMRIIEINLNSTKRNVKVASHEDSKIKILDLFSE